MSSTASIATDVPKDTRKLASVRQLDLRKLELVSSLRETTNDTEIQRSLHTAQL